MWVIDRLRWLVLLGWLAGVVAAIAVLPTPPTGTALGDLVPKHTPALTAQQRSLDAFTIPVVTGTVVVLHNPHGLAPAVVVDAALRALAVDLRLATTAGPAPADRVLGALPVIDPTDRTTLLTYLYFGPGTDIYTQRDLARRYARHFRHDRGAHTYVTGLVPAELAQGHYLNASLIVVELATLAFVTVVVALVFGSLIAPLLILGGAALAFVADRRLLGWLSVHTSLGLPAELEPLVVALLLGVVTDYSVFFLSSYRKRLAAGDSPRAASRLAVTETAPIVLVAGLTVAAGCAALAVAPTRLFRAFGPGLAITVAVAAITSVTMIPAAMTILGRFAFWPSRPRPRDNAERRTPDQRRSYLAAAVSHRFGAAVAALICLAVMVVAALPVARMRLSLSFARTLPASDEVRQGIRALSDTFPRGITNPTEVLVEGDGVTRQRAALGRLQHALGKQPGVAMALGPAQNPSPYGQGLFLAGNGGTARVVLVFDSDPLGAKAVADLRRIEDDGRALIHHAGLHDARLAYAGDTAIASDVARITVRNLLIILLAAFGVELIILACYLRALIAPLFLLLCSATTVASALGLTVLVFQIGLGVNGLTFYVPFSAAVLLVALGADYNVFGIGSVWHQARHVPIRVAIRNVLPRTARAISTAGVTLAGSFALVALVPLLTFAELAFALAVGLLIDTFVVRSILTPSLLTLIGRASGWPGHALRGRRGERAGYEPAPDLRPEPARLRRRRPGRPAPG